MGICIMASFYYYIWPESFRVLLSCANWGFCYLNLTGITKSKYEKKNEKNSGLSSKMTLSCNWPTGQKKKARVARASTGNSCIFFISAFRSYFIFLNFQAYLSLRNSRLLSRKLFWTSENSCKEYFVERKQIKSTTATYLLQTSNVWRQNLSSLNHITTY